MKSVLVTTDFSPHSRYALRYALKLFKHAQVPVRILLLNTYLVNMDNDGSGIIQLNDELKRQSKLSLEEQKSEVLEEIESSNLLIETASHMGSLSNVITNLLRRQKFDLVVMGKDGGNHVEQIADLLKKYKCPLLITYDDEQHKLKLVHTSTKE